MASTPLDNCLLQGSATASPIRTAATAHSPAESSLNSPGRLAPSHARAPRRAMRCFVSRPFPPPALANVPVEYIIDQLHTLAPHYWSKPETADCSISKSASLITHCQNLINLSSPVIPLDGLLRKTGQAPQSSGPAPDSFASLMAQSDGLSRAESPGCRPNEPTLRPAPRMVMKVRSTNLGRTICLLTTRTSFTWITCLLILRYSGVSSAGHPRST